MATAPVSGSISTMHPCVATAVADAVAHLGIEVDRLPIRPDRLLAELRAASETAEGSRPG